MVGILETKCVFMCVSVCVSALVRTCATVCVGLGLGMGLGGGSVRIGVIQPQRQLCHASLRTAGRFVLFFGGWGWDGGGVGGGGWGSSVTSFFMFLPGQRLFPLRRVL